MVPTKQIKEIIVEALELEIDPGDIDDDDLLFGNHFGLDSVSTLVLIEALEDEFNVEVEDEELTPELFESAKVLAEFIQKKVQSI